MRGGVGAIVAMGLLSLFGVNCFHDPMTPVAPKWDVGLTVPLANRTFTLAEIIERDSSMLSSGQGNLLTYSTVASIQPVTVGDRISLMPQGGSASLQLGPFQVSLRPAVVPVLVPGLPQGTAPIPPMTSQIPDINNAVSTPGEATFASGNVSLSLKNNLPVVMQILDTVQLVNTAGVVQAGFFFPSPIPPGGSAVAYDNLAGARLESGITLTGLRFSTPGSASQPVTVPPDSQLVATVTMSNLLAENAEIAEIPAQNLINNVPVTLDVTDSTLVQMAQFKSGVLTFTFVNGIDLNVLYRFRLSEFQKRMGGTYVPFEDSLMLPALGSRTYSLNVSGLRLQSRSGGFVRKLEVVNSVVMPNATSRVVAVHDTDRVSITFAATSPLIADSAVGLIKPTWIDVNTTVPMNFGKLSSKFTGSLNIPSASLDLNISSSLAFPADLNLSVTAKDGSGRNVLLSIPASQRRMSAGGGSIHFDPADVGAFLSALSSKFPDSVRVSGRVLVNPPDVYSLSAPPGAIGRNSAFASTVNFHVPMKLGITNGTYRDTMEVGDGGGMKTEGVNFGRLYLEVQNALPVQVSLSVKLLGADKSSLLVIPRGGNTINVAAAQVGVDGLVTTATPSTTVIELDQYEVRRIDPARYLDVMVAMTSAPGGPAVGFRTSDYVHVRAWSEFSYRVGK